MTVQEARDFFAGSDFSTETKSKINAVLASAATLGPAEIAAIKALMQEELDKDFEETGADFSAIPEIREAEAAHGAAQAGIEKEFADDMAYIETEVAQFDEVRKKLAAVSDHLEADAIKQTI